MLLLVLKKYFRYAKNYDGTFLSRQEKKIAKRKKNINGYSHKGFVRKLIGHGDFLIFLAA